MWWLLQGTSNIMWWLGDWIRLIHPMHWFQSLSDLVLIMLHRLNPMGLLESINGPLQDLWLARAGGVRPVGTPQWVGTPSLDAYTLGHRRDPRTRDCGAVLHAPARRSRRPRDQDRAPRQRRLRPPL